MFLHLLLYTLQNPKELPLSLTLPVPLLHCPSHNHLPLCQWLLQWLRHHRPGSLHMLQWFHQIRHIPLPLLHMRKYQFQRGGNHLRTIRHLPSLLLLYLPLPWKCNKQGTWQPQKSEVPGFCLLQSYQSYPMLWAFLFCSSLHNHQWWMKYIHIFHL